jgi:hypothetical protein
MTLTDSDRLALGLADAIVRARLVLAETQRKEWTMNEVTGEQVQAAVMKAGITRIEYFPCSTCGYPVAWLVQNGELYFDPGCDCTRRQPLRPRKWKDAAQWINMQDTPATRSEIAARFGLTL